MTSIGGNGFHVGPGSVNDEATKSKSLESKHQKLVEKIKNVSDDRQLHKICEEIKASSEFQGYKESYEKAISSPIFKSLHGKLKEDAKNVELLFDLALIHTVTNVDIGATNRAIQSLNKGVKDGNSGPRAKL